MISGFNFSLGLLVIIIIVIVVLVIMIKINETKQVQNFTVNNDDSDTNNLDYENTVLNQNKNVIYFYNDILDQTKISENADDIINNKSKVNYSNIQTGMDKCKKNCYGGEGYCLGLYYDGTASCYPPKDYTKKFDLGTLYKNPAFYDITIKNQ
jgi:hypothetical protein